MEIEQSFVILNELGLHARAATRFVQTTNKFKAEVEVEKDGQKVNGKSIMGVLMLVASRGSSITVRCKGDDAATAMQAITELIQRKFGEE